MNFSFLSAFLVVACLAMVQMQAQADNGAFFGIELPQGENFSKLRAHLKKRCQPGQQFKLDCNSCTCTEEGNDFLCSRRNCPGSNISPSDLICAPSMDFKDGCNTCICNARGSDYICTRKDCTNGIGDALTGDGGALTNGDGGALTNGDGGALTGDGGALTKVCSPGQTTRVQCNTCICNSAGTKLACSRRVCRNANQAEGDGGALTGDGGALTEVGSDKLCTRKDCTHNFNNGGDGGALSGDGGALTGDGGALTGDGGALTGDGGALTGDGGALTGDGGALTGDGGALTGDGGALTKVCSPGQTTRVQCNTCICNSAGTKLACSRRVCRNTNYAEGDGGALTGDGGALTGDGGALTGVGGDKLCTRKDCTHNFNNGGDGGALTGDGGALTGDGGALTGDGGALTGDGGALTGDGGALTNPSYKKCQPLRVFKEGCNTCMCNLLGTRYTCTNRNCNG